MMFLDYSSRFLHQTFCKLRKIREERFFELLKKKAKTCSFQNDSKKIFYKLAFASLIISILKFRKNFLIHSFKKIRDVAILNENTERGGIGNFGLSRCDRKRIKADVEKEFLMRKFKVKCEEKKKKINFTSIGFLKSDSKLAKKSADLKVKKKSRLKNQSLVHLRLLPKKTSTASISSLISNTKRERRKIKREVKNRFKNKSRKKASNRSFFDLEIRGRKRENNKKSVRLFNSSIHKMRNIDRKLEAKRNRGSSRKNSFLSKMKKADFENKKLDFQTLGNKMVTAFTIRGSGKIDSSGIMTKRSSGGYFEGVLVESRRFDLDERLNGIRRKFNLKGKR